VSADARIAAAERALADAGVFGASVGVEGHEREIAAIRVPEDAWGRMMGPDGASIAQAVKRAGFRYVALDLAPADEAGAN
jgi:PP-loop superfamily ATP-utilizing enzyme